MKYVLKMHKINVNNVNKDMNFKIIYVLLKNVLILIKMPFYVI